ncbi:alpha/beta hydrolase [Roseicyclus sp. F158]|uniref:Palmitoyl-protein thioesterase ABHD10, mitochondrial n=1 Tax=Tropicimonas omnivorans TaxID=3075590 RepID=A0ABU3DHX1_9RHOB|nr:alpha/beta hydrolase [Roseicyclus sp. F158]MDT0683306.1 alpha/beta hydrolase [Roseicyclus sp. F158]
MPETPDFLETAQGRRLAYRRIEGTGPWIVFLGGLRSDMEGTKALHLEAWAKRERRAFLRFDYSGHGASSGTFEEGAIGDWAEDTAAMLETLPGDIVLVGSSMGGWQALLAARAMPGRVRGLVTIAAAPDFTEDGYAASFTPAERSKLEREGRIARPSEYGEDMIITRRLIEDGRSHLVLRTPLSLPMPVRMLQGTADDAVEVSVATRLLDHAEGPDMRLTLVKDADHRMSSPAELALIEQALREVLVAAEGAE